MDVHPPHEPIHTVRDFLLHLLTITIGLLIALGLEATVEHIHHRSLVREARANMASEIADNQRAVTEFLANLDKDQKAGKQGLATLEEIRHTHNSKGKNFAYHWSFSELEDTSWKTAQVTGAIAFMDYAEAKRYSEIYNTQKLFADAEDQSMEAVNSIGMAGDPAQLTSEQLLALQHSIAVAMLHFDTLGNIARSLNQEYTDFHAHQPS
jgi:hypothetical protein